MSNYMLIQNKLINLDQLELISINGEWISFKGRDTKYEFHMGSEMDTLFEALKYKLIDGYKGVNKEG